MSFGIRPGEFRDASEGRGRETKRVNETGYITSLLEWYVRSGKISQECNRYLGYI